MLKKLFGKTSTQASSESSKPNQSNHSKGKQQGSQQKNSQSKGTAHKGGQNKAAKNKANNKANNKTRQSDKAAQKSPNKPTKPAWDPSQFKVPAEEGRLAYPELSLHPELLHSIYDLGFEYCTPIQAQTLPHTLKGLDVIGKAQTGTGKTAAFLITAIDQLLSHPVAKEDRYYNEPRVLVLAPTRELVHQIEQDAKELTKHTNLHTVSLVGGEPQDKQRKQLDKAPVDIMAATPGRLIDFVMQKLVYLDQVEVLVLDEADRMLDMGFIPQVKQIVRSTPMKENRQTLLFSATFTYDILNLAERWTYDATKFEIEPESVATETVDQQFYMVADGDKLDFLLSLINRGDLGQTIIFTNRRDQTQTLYNRLKKAGVSVGVLSGEVAQAKRTKTLADFKQGKIQYLIGTDVVGRGIHIDGITHVINFYLPQEPENYVHRIGRTGRAGASGQAISFIGEEDAYEVPALEKCLGHKIDMQHPPSV